MLAGVFAKIALLAVVTTHAPAVHVTVHPGDTLSRIAAAQCGGKVDDWTGIYKHNRAIIGSNPNLIVPGQRLKIVCRDPEYLLALAAPAVPQPAPAQAQAPAAAPAQQPATVSTGGMGSFQQCVIRAESGGNPAAVNASSGAGGLYQFLPSTWAALGFPGLPENAPVWMQNEAFAKEYAQSGTSAWSAYDGC